MEMLEAVLMRGFMSLYIHDIEADDDCHPVKSGKSLSAERRAYTTLASVCWNFHRTLIGWPQSPTSEWVRHQLKKMIESECFKYCIVKLE